MNIISFSSNIGAGDDEAGDEADNAANILASSSSSIILLLLLLLGLVGVLNCNNMDHVRRLDGCHDFAAVLEEDDGNVTVRYADVLVDSIESKKRKHKEYRRCCCSGDNTILADEHGAENSPHDSRIGAVIIVIIVGVVSCFLLHL